MQAVGLQTHIWNNNIRSGVLLALFPVLLLVIIYILLAAAFLTGVLPSTGSVRGDLAQSGRWMLGAAPLALVVAALWFLIAYFANTKIVAMATGSKPVTRAEQPDLYNLLENLAISRGLPMPRLNIIESPALNAFASGVTDKQYTVTVTTGLLEALDRDELEAVLAHELTHIINRDVRTMIVAAVFAGIFTLAAELLFRGVFYSRLGGRRGGGKGSGPAILVFIVIAIAVVALGRLLAVVIRMTLSRTREFVADAGAVELTKKPDAMIAALRKISGGADQLKAPEEVRAMFLENKKKAGVFSLFATHPPIDKRIEALVEFAGGMDLPVETEPEQAGPWG